MSLLANHSPFATSARTRSVTRVRPADAAPATPCVVDVAGSVWTHPNPLYLYRWIDRRNELLRTVAVAPRQLS